MKSKKIVIVGASFIGMEMASTLKKLNKNAEVIVIDVNSTPFETALGKDLGYALQRLHEKNGVKFYTKRRVLAIKPKSKGKSNDIGSIIISKVKGDEEDGSNNNEEEVMESDMLLFGTGVLPNTEIMNNLVTLENDKIKCDAYLCSSDPNIFSAGDSCSYPSIFTGERINSSHYVAAQQQGAIAALNMMNKKVQYNYIPYYWTRMWDKSLQYVGYAPVYDEIFINGNLNDKEMKFEAYYIKGNKVIAFACMNSPNSANIIYEAFRNNIVISGKSIKSGELSISSIKNMLKLTKGKCSKINCVCFNKSNKNI